MTYSKWKSRRNTEFGGDPGHSNWESKFEVKGQGHWELKCTRRFCAYLRQKWIDLHRAKINMIFGPLYIIVN